MMRWFLLALALAMASGMSGPAKAQTSIRGKELSTADITRVRSQCTALLLRESDSVANPQDPPAAGEIVSDPANMWAEGANEMDRVLSKVDLNTLTVKECREAGFYD